MIQTKSIQWSCLPLLAVIVPVATLAHQAKQGVKPGKELLINGNFQKSASSWIVEENGAKGKGEVVKEGPTGKSAFRIKVLEVGDNSWRLQIHQGNLKIVKGKPYVFEFWVKTDRDAVITVNCMQNHEPWEHHGAAAEVKISRTWQKITLPFSGPWDETNARVTFTNLGTVVGQTYWFADCSLKEIKK